MIVVDPFFVDIIQQCDRRTDGQTRRCVLPSAALPTRCKNRLLLNDKIHVSKQPQYNKLIYPFWRSS